MAFTIKEPHPKDLIISKQCHLKFTVINGVTIFCVLIHMQYKHVLHVKTPRGNNLHGSPLLRNQRMLVFVTYMSFY